MFFKKPVDLIQNNILLEASEVELPEPIGESNSMINYYFNVFVDNEIDKSDICDAVGSLASKSLFVDLDIECFPEITPSRYDIYTGPEPIDACPPPVTSTDASGTSTDASGTSETNCDD